MEKTDANVKLLFLQLSMEYAMLYFRSTEAPLKHAVIVKDSYFFLYIVIISLLINIHESVHLCTLIMLKQHNSI